MAASSTLAMNGNGNGKFVTIFTTAIITASITALVTFGVSGIFNLGADRQQVTVLAEKQAEAARKIESAEKIIYELQTAVEVSKMHMENIDKSLSVIEQAVLKNPHQQN